MTRQDFGELVAALRQENPRPTRTSAHPVGLGKTHPDAVRCPVQSSANAEVMTRGDLAALTGLPCHVISGLEAGDPTARLGADTLGRLAAGLRLTTGETERLFLAALDLTDDGGAPGLGSPNAVFRDLLGQKWPAGFALFVMDAYWDLIAVNQTFVRVMGLDSAGLDTALCKLPYRFGHNALYYIISFAAQQYYRPRVSGWESFVQYSIEAFRTSTFTYRAHSYFQRLLSGLKTYPVFDYYWNLGRHTESEEPSVEGHLHLAVSPWGPLRLSFARRTIVTTAGDLNLCVGIPQDVATSEALAYVGRTCDPRMIVLSHRWPEKL